MGPSYAVSVTTSGSGATWNDTTNALTEDGMRATASPGFPSDTLNLDVFGFPFSTIPLTATINGIVAEVGVYSAPGTTVHDGAIYLIKTGAAISADRKRSPGYTWPASGEVVTYGTATDIGSWGAISASDVTNSTFGFRLKGTITSIGGTAAIDFVRLTVYYTPLGGSVYDSFMDLIRAVGRKISCQITPSSACAK